MRAAHKSIGTTTALTLVILFLLPGCKDTKGAVAYSKQLNQANLRFKAAGERFVQAHNKVANEGPAHIGELRQAHKEAQECVVSVRAELKTWKVPDRPSGQALAAAYEKFLSTQDDIINKDMDEIVKTWEVPRMPLKEREDKIGKALKKTSERENPALAELRAAQQACADDYNFKINK